MMPSPGEIAPQNNSCIVESATGSARSGLDSGWDQTYHEEQLFVLVPLSNVLLRRGVEQGESAETCNCALPHVELIC